MKTDENLMTDDMQPTQNLRYRMTERDYFGVEEEAENEIEALGIPSNDSTDDYDEKIQNKVLNLRK